MMMITMTTITTINSKRKLGSGVGYLVCPLEEHMKWSSWTGSYHMSSPSAQHSLIVREGFECAKIRHHWVPGRVEAVFGPLECVFHPFEL